MNGKVPCKSPIVGDRCVFGICSGAAGGITISNGVVVAANSFVNKDINEENIMVAGNPAIKKTMNGSFSWETAKRYIGKDK